MASDSASERMYAHPHARREIDTAMPAGPALDIDPFLAYNVRYD